MAGIDKTYCNSYQEYKEFKDWAEKQIITFFNGYKECVGDYVYSYDESDFNDVEIYEGLSFYIGDEYCRISTISEYNKIATIVSYEKPDIAKSKLDFESIKKFVLNRREIPIMNTPTWLDVYLIQNCKIEFVLDRMKAVYDTDFDELMKVDLTAKPSEKFKQNRKIVIRSNKWTTFQLHSKPYETKNWWLQCDDCDWWYHTNSKTWSNSYYPNNTNTASFPSIKSMVRHLRKQYLPKGLKFTISGGCVGEQYTVIIK